MNPVWLGAGSLLFTATAYYLLKNYLVEWGCRTFLKGRVRLESDKKKSEATQNGHTHTLNGVITKPVSTESCRSVKLVTKGDMAEVAQL